MDDLVFEKIENLTDQEIDNLMYEKWFGSLLPQFINLVKSPINKDIDTLNQLSQMYSETISQIDDEINTLEKEFNQLLSELVVK
ncbi:hypothetical protein [Limosilactobacillus equigenerosi]|uniref:hypothetical protein n=1 Tax=Limosilactobacillus equigenerosi TaxID=417373 RepID=UPI0009ECC522|nr:hypothetical protein [Limosilactobacillus equigenerosi]